MKYPIILFLITVLGSACKTAQQTNRISYGGSFGTQAEEKLEKSNSEVEKQVIPTQPKAKGEAKLAFPLQATGTIHSEKYLKPEPEPKILLSDSSVVQKLKQNPVEPNSKLALIFAIIGVMVVPVIPHIIALVLSIVGIEKYKQEPSRWRDSSFGMARAAKIISIIYLSLVLLYVLVLLAASGYLFAF